LLEVEVVTIGMKRSQTRVARLVGCPLSGGCGVSTFVLPLKGGFAPLMPGVGRSFAKYSGKKRRMSTFFFF
jgi:hypothetical protein